MGRKVFVSVLGTGYYGECRYAAGDSFVSSPTRFIQQAMVELFGVRSWKDTDAVYILLTEQARGSNWIVPDSRKKNPRTGEMEDYEGLHDILADLPIVHEIDIPIGKDEDEMWQIFTTVFEQIQTGDELYFDLTHGLRYLPMLILVLGSYAKYLKHVTVKAISYGSYETRDTVTGLTPIVDLLPLSALQDWTFAAADFTENGNISRLAGISRDYLNPMIRTAVASGDKEQKQAADNLKYFVNSAQRFTDELTFCRGMSTYESKTYAKMLSDAAASRSDIIRPLQPVIAAIVGSTSTFKDSREVWNCFAAARWCFDKGYYQPAVTELQEGVVSYFCVRHGIGVDDEKRRPAVNGAFELRKKQKNGETFTFNGDEKLKPVIEEIASDPLLDNKELIDAFGNLTNIRNDFNHAGMRSSEKPLDPRKICDGIGRNLEKIIRILYPGE